MVMKIMYRKKISLGTVAALRLPKMVFPRMRLSKMVLQKMMVPKMMAAVMGIVGMLMMVMMSSCDSNSPTDATATIRFSVDTLMFDTVFTSQGSATKIVMLHNDTKSPLIIDKVTQQDGSSFLVNLDGEDSLAYLRNIRLPAGDSLYLFVRAIIDPQNSQSPVLVTDRLTFYLSNGNTSVLCLEAYGQDVTLIDSMVLYDDYTFVAAKPYLVRYYIASAPEAKVTIEPGAAFYMHKGASAVFYGPLEAKGTPAEPIVFCGDRLDDYISGIPYAYMPGQWEGVYLYDNEGVAPEWHLANVRIVSAVNGLFCYGKSYTQRPTLTLHNARIHNNDQYGLILLNTDAAVGNCEISNCASYCIYMDGGEATFVHNTIAAYYRHTAYNSNVGLYDTPREDVAAVYLNNISKAKTTKASFYNNIITGVRANQLMIASPFPDLYTGEFKGNYLKTDTLRLPNASDNAYAKDSDTVFVNDYYSDYRYFDFRLDSLSPARGIADSVAALAFPTDMTGLPRTTLDAGCYVYTEMEE